MATILVCEDEKNIRRLIRESLLENGYEVLEAIDGEDALRQLDTNHIDLLITDIMMPRLNGYELTGDLRNAGYEIPILILSAKEAFLDKKNGFALGADDYMVKPVDMDELLLRVYALLRRAKISLEKKIEIGSTTLNSETLSVTTRDQVIELPKKEFQILYKLLSHPKKIFTRRQIMDEFWGLEVESDERTVDVHIKRIREKFGSNPDFEILTIRGLGYKAEKR